MRKSYTAVFSVVAIMFGCLVKAEAQTPETLRLQSGRPMEVKLLSWDFTGFALKVELPDGTIKELAAEELHASDIKKIQRLFNKQVLTSRKSGSRSDSRSESTTEANSSKGNSQVTPLMGFPSGARAFSHARGITSGNGSAMATGSAGGFAFGSISEQGSPAKESKSGSPGNPDSAGSFEDDSDSSSVFSGMININGKVMRFETHEEFDRAMKDLREKRR